jgi:hypothetical protein
MESMGVAFVGMEELQKKFMELSNLDRKKFFITEFKPIGAMLVRAMKAQTPVYPGKYWTSKQYTSRNHPRGTLRDSIGMKVGGSEIPVIWVSLNRNRDAWYQHMVVGGHKHKGTTVKANPIVKRTWEAMGGIVEGQLKMKFENKIKAMMK